ncbi:hypothetical protein FA95DRAFT_1611996 [Auriscalpium vulgare]|uniref:Uncharacterized protein n=1 Tax=Auriscalpium vulgare TaxID=40419 RepID=A0ACB8R7U5_9AGAM|nr:hypothetical protein FA95DRAFT_1611996 [Auriscalpium vulgare]
MVRTRRGRIASENEEEENEPTVEEVPAPKRRIGKQKPVESASDGGDEEPAPANPPLRKSARQKPTQKVTRKPAQLPRSTSGAGGIVPGSRKRAASSAEPKSSKASASKKAKNTSEALEQAAAGVSSRLGKISLGNGPQDTDGERPAQNNVSSAAPVTHPSANDMHDATQDWDEDADGLFGERLEDDGLDDELEQDEQFTPADEEDTCNAGDVEA